MKVHKIYVLFLISKCYEKRLENVTVKFSNLTNFVSLLGGKIKSNQMLSGTMADILVFIICGLVM